MAFESLHGLMNPKATVFPQCAGLGGTFDRELIYKMAKIIGRECKALGTKKRGSGKVLLDGGGRNVVK